MNIACLLFVTEESPEEEAMQARPVYVAAVDLSCKILMVKLLFHIVTICIPVVIIFNWILMIILRMGVVQFGRLFRKFKLLVLTADFAFPWLDWFYYLDGQP